MKVHFQFCPAPNAQRGAALITVLLIVAMATVIATYMAQQQGFWQREFENARDRAQARRIAQAGVDWARAVLADDAASNQYDYAGEMWAMQLPAIPIEDGEVQGLIVDQQGLFNLNNLVQNGAVNANDLVRLQRLLSILSLPPELANSLANWMKGEPKAAGAAEDSYYLQLPKPYRAAHQSLSELSELMWVQGFDTQIIKRLSGFVTALPTTEHTPVNVNFATAEVLAAVVDGLPLQAARQIVSDRKDSPFKAMGDFLSKLPSGAKPDSSALTVASKYFLVEGHAVQGQGEFSAQALLVRNAMWATVVRQSVQ